MKNNLFVYYIMQTDSVHFRKMPLPFQYLRDTLAEQIRIHNINPDLIPNPQPLVMGSEYLIGKGPGPNDRDVYIYHNVDMDGRRINFIKKEDGIKKIYGFPFERIYNGVQGDDKYYIYPDREFQGDKEFGVDTEGMTGINLFAGGVKSKKNLYRNGFYYNKRTKKSKKNKIHDSLRFGKQPKVLKSKKKVKKSKKN